MMIQRMRWMGTYRTDTLEVVGKKYFNTGGLRKCMARNLCLSYLSAHSKLGVLCSGTSYLEGIVLH